MKNIYQFSRRETIEQEARQWLIRFDSDLPPKQRDIDALKEWCQQSPAHLAEFQRIAAFWDEADLLTKFAIPVKASDSRIYHRVADWLHSLFASPQRAMASSAFAVVLAAAIWFTPQVMESDWVGNRTFSTAIGEQLTRSLNDGSVVQLNTNTKLTVEFSDERRVIRLLKGEAHFDVAHNPERPFEVYTSKGVVRAVGTAFSVRVESDDIEVTVSEGVVALSAIIPEESSSLPSDFALPEANLLDVPKAPKPLPLKQLPLKELSLKELGHLESGHAATFAEVIKQVQELDVPELNRELAWRKGILAFSTTPLSEVVAEVSRYSPAAIEITDPELGKLNIGGRFKVGELDALFGALEASFGVQVSRLDKNHIQLSPSEK